MLCRTLGSLLFIGMIGVFEPRVLKEAIKLATLALLGVSITAPFDGFNLSDGEISCSGLLASEVEVEGLLWL